MSNWQWRWLLVTEADIDYLHNFSDQWQFAVARHSLLMSARSEQNTSSTAQGAAAAAGPSEASHQSKDLLLYSLLPRHGPAGLTRVPNLEAQISSQERDSVFVGRLRHKLNAEDGNFTFETLGSLVKELLFPDATSTYKNLMGRTLVATANNDPPFFKFADMSCFSDPSKRCVAESGIDLNLLYSLAGSLNFRYKEQCTVQYAKSSFIRAAVLILSIVKIMLNRLSFYYFMGCGNSFGAASTAESGRFVVAAVPCFGNRPD